jgi:hypothetical protein
LLPWRRAGDRRSTFGDAENQRTEAPVAATGQQAIR